MKEGLSRETRELIQQAHGFDDATSADRARVRSQLTACLAAGAIVSTATKTSQAASALGTKGTLQSLLSLKKVALITAAVGASAVVALWPAEEEPRGRGGAAQRARVVVSEPQQADHTTPDKTTAHRQDLAPSNHATSSSGEVDKATAGEEMALAAKVSLPSPSRVPVVTLVEVAAPVVLNDVTKVPPVALVAQRGKAIRSEVPELTSPERAKAAGSQLGDELLVLSQIRSALAAQNPQLALKLLSRFSQEFSTPILGIEAHALKVEALCRAENITEARREANRFLERWPDSPLARSVALTCHQD